MSRDLLKRVFDECAGRGPSRRGSYEGFSERDWEQAWREIVYISQAFNHVIYLDEPQAFFVVDTVVRRVHATPKADGGNHAISGMELLTLAAYINSCRSS